MTQACYILRAKVTHGLSCTDILSFSPSIPAPCLSIVPNYRSTRAEAGCVRSKISRVARRHGP